MRTTMALALCLTCIPPLRASQPIELPPELRQRCLDVLQSGLRSDEFWPAMHAAEALTYAGQQHQVLTNLAERAATETDDQHRCGLAREMVRAGQTERAADLLAILDKPDTYAHTHAAESLYKVAQAGNGEALRAALKRDELPKLQLMAAAALVRSGDTAPLAFIRQRLADADAENRQIAAWLLALLGNDSDIPQLLANARSETNPLVRAYQEHALACLGNAYGLEKLAANLTSSDPMIRTYAAEFAGYARATHLADALAGMLDDPYLDARIRAAQSLILLSKQSE
jgi:sialidase-1